MFRSDSWIRYRTTDFLPSSALSGIQGLSPAILYCRLLLPSFNHDICITSWKVPGEAVVWRGWRHCLWSPHPRLECLGSSLGMTPNSSFLVAHTLGGGRWDDSSSWIPATHMGESDGVLGSSPGPAPAVLGIWLGEGESADGSAVYICLANK